MKQWTLTVYDSRGARSEVEAGEREFILGSESAFGVMRVVGNGVAPRHARVKYGGERLVVEKLGGETFVNGSPIEGRVEVEYPASVEVGDVTLVVEPISNEPAADRIAVTIPLPVRKKPEPLPEPEPPPTPEALAARIAITIPAPMKKEPAPAVRPPQTPAPDFDIHLAETIPFQRQPVADDPDATIIQPRSNAPGRGGRVESARVAKAPLKGEYTLVKEIARGGMGQIYFGEDPQLKREVAVKVSSISEGGEDLRFTKEAEVLAQLAHPNVVPIYNIGVDGERRPFYAMKLVKGRTLQAVLNAIRDRDKAALKDYPLATLLTIFRKVCDAMAFAHSKRILHRDLKPENIMVGEYGEVLVMDWGLAKVLGGSGGDVLGVQDTQTGGGSGGGTRSVASTARVNESGDFGMTMEGEVMGTPQYMSPEQAEGMVAELDERSDIYSLGGVLYAILTLRPPIDGKTLNEVLTKVKNGQISSMITKRGGKDALQVGAPAAMGREVPEALRAVTLKAMAKDRAKRYGSVEEFATDLEAYQNGFATRAEDAGTLRKLVLFVKRHKAVSVLVSAMLLGAVLFTVRLAASEKVALANAERAAASAEEAKRNEQKAQASAQEAKTSAKKALESESLAVANAKKAEESAAESRRSAAMAELTAAEGAEAIGNVQQMRDSLSRVPNDLRSQTWEYLDRRLNSMDMVIKAPEGSPWVTMVPVLDQAGVFYTLQQDGSVRVLDLNTGSADLLFKAGSSSGSAGLLLSGDGLRLAVASNLKVKIFNVQDASLVSELITAHQITATTMVGGSNLKMRGCLNRDGSRLLSVAWSTGQGSLVDSRFQLWDVDGKRVLWNSPWKERCVVEFTSDNRLMMLTDEGLSELDPNSGDVLTRFSKITYPVYGPNSAATFATDAKWDFLFTVGGDGILRKTMSKDGAVTLGMSAWGSGLGEFQTFQYLAKSKRLITLVSTSLAGGQMQVWKDNGILCFSIPVLSGTAPKLGVHPASEDLCLMRRRDILVWRLGVHPSLSKEPWGDYGTARFRASGFIYPRGNRASFKRNREELQLNIAENRKSIQSLHVHGADGSSGFSSSFSYISPMICKNPNGDWFAVSSTWQRGAVFRFHATEAGVDGGAVITVDPKRLPNSVDCPPSKNRCMSPDGQKLWMGNMVLGAEAESVPVEADRRGLAFKRVGGMLACWAGNECVAEIAVLNSAEGNEGGDALGKTVLVLWDAATGKRLKTVEALAAATLEGSPDGKWIAEGGTDKRIRFRDAKTLEVVREIRAHDAPVGDLKWHHTLPLLVSAGADQWIRVWEPETGRLLEEFRRVDLIPEGLDISADGLQLGIGNWVTTEIFSPKSFAVASEK